MGNTHFYRCMGCGNFVMFIGQKTGCTPKCCGEPMTEIIPNTVDAAKEKHIPDVSIFGSMVVVKVGSTAHPMTPEHHIEFVCLETDKGGQIHYFNPEEEPVTTFYCPAGEKLVAAYAYCNLHSLWKSE